MEQNNQYGPEEDKIHKFIYCLENYNCIQCNKWKGNSTEEGWKDGFCCDECHQKFAEANPENESLLHTTKNRLTESVEQRKKKRYDRVNKFVANIKNKTCPNCQKKSIGFEKTQLRGVCSNECYREFVASDPDNERYWNEAQGIDAHIYHNTIEVREKVSKFPQAQNKEFRTEGKKEENEPIKKAA